MSKSDLTLPHNFFDILSHPIRIYILKQLDIGIRSFSQIMSNTEDIESSKINFHLKKLLNTGIVEKYEKNYQLSEIGINILQFLEAFEISPMGLSAVLTEEDDHEEELIQTEEKDPFFGEEPSLQVLPRPDNLPPAIRTFDLFIGKNTDYMIKQYSDFSLPKPLDANISPTKWIKQFIKPINKLKKDPPAFAWIEERYLKLAYGTRGLQDYAIMDAILAVPPLQSMIVPIQKALMERGKAGLFATTGMGKSRIILYLAHWWIKNHQSQVLFIDNPLDLFDWEWKVLNEILAKHSQKKTSPWLIIIEDTHLAPLDTLEIIKKLVARAGPHSWSIMISFTEKTQITSDRSIITRGVIPTTVQSLKNELQPLEITQYLNLTTKWPEWRPYFHEWVQWVALDVLFEKLPWDTRSWKNINFDDYQSPWAFVVALGFLKQALSNIQISATSNFPLIMYALLAHLYLIRGERGIRQSQLLELIQKNYNKELQELVSENSSINEEITTLLNSWTEPQSRLLPPFQYSNIDGSLKKELVITFYHQEWAREVCNTLLSDNNSETTLMVSTLFNKWSSVIYQYWQVLNYSASNPYSNFLTWMRQFVQVELNKEGHLSLVNLKMTKEDYPKAKTLSLNPTLLAKLNQTQLLNWSFIKAVIANYR
ncbi:MAG: winged helix-turn-helix domain-containing protein [Candidatus Hodarchaeales archaeon]|jgi:DNA-binding transcriptional ArsR family regulator